VTFLLATILGTLRDGGRDIQRAVGGSPVDLVKPLTAKLFPMVMMMGLMVLMGAVAAGIVVAVDESNYWLHASSQVASGPQTAALSSDLSDIQSIRAWLQPLDFVGMGLILSGIVLALATDDTTLDAIALALGGCACVLAICVAFYAVGRSEDEQRARDEETS